MRFDPQKWYFKDYVFIIGFLCIGPFILPLAWINPRYSTKTKLVITTLTLTASYILSMLFARSMESLMTYYQQVIQLKEGAR
jgi:hypothetical protein